MIEPCRLEGVLKRLGRLFALANIGIKQQMELKPFLGRGIAFCGWAAIRTLCVMAPLRLAKKNAS